MPVLIYIVTALAAYLLGSIPFGFLVAKAKGIDIRSVGSGNIGATNAMRVLGKSAGIAVLLLDVLKGFAAVCLCNFFLLPFNTPEYHYETHYILMIAGICAVFGHNYTCWLKFKGGKGIATTAGVYLALAPEALGIALVVFILTILVTRYVSVGSIAAAIALTVAVWIVYDPVTACLYGAPDALVFAIVTTALCALAIYKHKPNIQRLMAGTESRLGQKKEAK